MFFNVSRSAEFMEGALGHPREDIYHRIDPILLISICKNTLLLLNRGINYFTVEENCLCHKIKIPYWYQFSQLIFFWISTKIRHVVSSDFEHTGWAMIHFIYIYYLELYKCHRDVQYGKGTAILGELGIRPNFLDRTTK